jgi:hypothetical protein
MKKLLTTLTVLLVAATTMAQVPSYVPTDGLVGWWPFNGNANDESGNGNNGTTMNGVALTADRFGNPNSAFSFDGVDDYIEIPIIANSNFIGSFTVAYWMNYDNNNSSTWTYRYPIFKGTAGLNNDFNSRLNPSNKSEFSIYNGSIGSFLTSIDPLSEFTDYFIVNVYDGSNMNTYINGLNDVTLISPFSPYITSTPVYVGNAQNLGFFLGDIDDIGIWNRALTEQEITDLYTGCANPITATITPNGNTTFCAGGFVQLTASAADSYLWSNGETTQTITATQAGQYTVTVTNNDGCSDTSDPVTVTVNPTPNSGVSVSGATTFCSGGSVTLTSQASSGSYLWSNGETTQSITVNQTGNYSVTVTDNGCSATSGVTAVTVNQTPTATITPQGNTTFCQGGFVVLQAAGGGTYQWNTGSQASSINVSQSGTYTVIVTDNGCNAQAQQQVTVNPLPTVTLAPFADLCENGAVVQLSGGSPSGGYYTVNGNATPELNPYTYGAGNHTIEYVYADNNGCVNTATQPVTINATPAVSMSGLNTNYTLTDPFSTLTGTPTGGVFNGAGMVVNYFDPSVAGLGTHGIAYIYVDGNGCIGSDAQCTTVDLNVNIGGSNIGVDEGSIDVYPNPSNGNFAVAIEGIEGIIGLSVFDARGREVLATSVVGNGQRTIQNIDLSNYANGVYTLSIRTAKGTASQKLVKE